jgi:hypothetical protein
MPYTEAQAKASAKYYQKVKEQKMIAYKERYENDEAFRELEKTRRLANYHKQKQRERLHLSSETSQTSENSNNTD